VAAWPGWLHPIPADAAYARRVAWGLSPDPGLVRTASLLQEWRGQGRLPDNYRGLILQHELADYATWFAPGVPVFATGRFDYHGPELAEMSKARKSLFTRDGDRQDSDAIREVASQHDVAYVVTTGGGAPPLPLNFIPVLGLTENTTDWKLWHIDGRCAVLGRMGARDANPAAFDRLAFDPVRLAFATPQVPVPPFVPTRASTTTPDLWDEFLTPAPPPAPVEALDSITWGEYVGLVYAELKVRPFRYAFETGSGPALGGGLGMLPHRMAGRLPSPPPGDDLVALQLLALRAGRRAIAAAPDSADAYLALSVAASNTSVMVPGMTADELQMLQVLSLRGYLDRVPPPS
jgi:hypothetical protein